MSLGLLLNQCLSDVGAAPRRQVDEYWNNLVLGMIGATIEPANMITGLRLVDKLSGLPFAQRS